MNGRAFKKGAMPEAARSRFDRQPHGPLRQTVASTVASSVTSSVASGASASPPARLPLTLPDGSAVELLPDGALHLPNSRTLVVADAHFGKAATFRARGVPVPQGTTRGTLARLDAALAATSATAVVFLGDLFHAREAHALETLATLTDWRQRWPALRLTLVEGNHDRHAGPVPAALAVEVVQEPWLMDGLALCHHPQQVAGRHVLAGHLHPCVWLTDGAGGLRLPCFWVRPSLTLLPAFGEFTGGAPIMREDGDTVVAVADGRLFRLPATR
jgi:DNA ligase-associated metallophosphoesterase